MHTGNVTSDSRLKLESMVIPTLLVIFLILLSINSQSLWSDELATAKIAKPDQWTTWLKAFVAWPDSDAQVPLYNIYVKMWVMGFGLTEYSLRAANIPWIVVCIFSLWFAPVSEASALKLRLMTLVLCVHPLMWYYANEARQYEMLLAGSAMAFAGMLGSMEAGADAVSGSRRALTFWCVGVLLLVATSLTGVLWSLAFIGPVLVFRWQMFGFKSGLVQWLASPLPLGTLGVAIACLVYYKYTIDRGVVAAVMGNKLSNYLFVAYEIFGLSGLGPGRTDLRAAEAGTSLYKTIAPYAPWLVLPGVAVVTVFVRGSLALRDEGKRRAILIICFGLMPIALFAVAAALKDFRIVGRHVFPLALFYCYVSAYGVWDLLGRGRPQAGLRASLKLGIVAIYGMVLILSSLSIRFADRHQRDDIRRAAEIARTSVERGEVVWWALDYRGADYYGVTIAGEARECSTPGVHGVVDVNYSTSADLQYCERPDVIVVTSRSPFFGRLTETIESGHYQLADKWTGFEVWRRVGATTRSPPR